MNLRYISLLRDGREYDLTVQFTNPECGARQLFQINQSPADVATDLRELATAIERMRPRSMRLSHDELLREIARHITADAPTVAGLSPEPYRLVADRLVEAALNLVP